MESMQPYRRFLRSERWKEWSSEGHLTDQKRGVPPPPIEKPVPDEAELFDLVAPDDLRVGRLPLIDVIRRRKSRRSYSDTPLSLEDVSFLLWATQGMRERTGGRGFRTVPSGGCRHAFESYLCVRSVEGLRPAVYRYLPVEHRLCIHLERPGLAEKVGQACNNQHFVGTAAAVFIWTAIPYRMEWRYTFLSHKVIAIDAGHVCQNLYLAAEAIGAGTCAVAAYDQNAMDDLLDIDGQDEFTVYIAPVGKV